jgi:hypothetical protein
MTWPKAANTDEKDAKRPARFGFRTCCRPEGAELRFARTCLTHDQKVNSVQKRSPGANADIPRSDR